MTAPEALRDLIVAALAVVGLAIVWIESVEARRADQRFAAVAREARHQADVRAARALLQRSEAQDALDAAYRAAEEQAHAAAEVGLGWSMPSREQCAAAAYDGTHERLLMCDAERALEVALLDGEFFHESRPPITVEPADPDDAKYW